MNRGKENIPTAFAIGMFGGGGWIRTIEVVDNRFTVCPLWPLGNSSICNFGAGGRTRTPDLLITNQLLYQLSYTSTSARPQQGLFYQKGDALSRVSLAIFSFFRGRGKKYPRTGVGGPAAGPAAGVAGGILPPVPGGAVRRGAGAVPPVPGPPPGETGEAGGYG